MRAPRAIARRRGGASTWGSSWLTVICEWRRWRRLGFSRWASLSILLASFHRVH